MHAAQRGHDRAVRRTGALRRGFTLPSNLPGLSEKMHGAEGSGNLDPDEVGLSQVERSLVKGRSLAPTIGLALKAVDLGDVNGDAHLSDGNHHSSDDDDVDNDSDFDDFTDDDEDDEIIYENPTQLVAEVQSLEQKRLEVAKELLHSEQTYFEKLTFLRMIKHQLDSMNSVKHIFPPEEPDRMFPFVEELFQFHFSIKTTLERTIRTWSPGSSSVARVFLPKLTEIQIYGEFIKQFPLSIKTLEMWREKEERFNKLLSIFQHNSSICLISLQDVMHEPYIRLQRLNLMFQRYRKCLPTMEREYTDIERVIRTIETILHDCEGLIRTADKLEALLKLAERIDGVLSHFDNDTHLLKEGSLIEVDPRGRHVGKKAFNKLENHLHLLLFNSFILICTPVEPNKKQTISSKVKISAVKLLSCDFFASMGYDSDCGFILQTPTKARLIVCPSAKDTHEWKELIEEAKMNASTRPSLKRERSLSTVDFSGAPVWIPDDYVSDCMLCLEQFTLIRRRHHCRGCGIIICSRCSPGKVRLPYDNLSTGRACRKCFRRAKNHKRELICTSARNSHEKEEVLCDEAEETIKNLLTFRDSGGTDCGRGEEEI